MLDEYIKIKQEELEKGQTSDGEENEKETAREIEAFMNQWSKDFDRINPNPEDNSDFDTDNEINPLDTLTPAEDYTSFK